eukprot:gene18712-10481_t
MMDGTLTEIDGDMGDMGAMGDMAGVDGAGGAAVNSSFAGEMVENNDEFAIEDTLDEPVYETIMRDVRSIGQKFYHVMLPHTNKQLLRDWDLWGPLAITMSLAIMLRHSAQEGQQTQVFTGVF